MEQGEPEILTALTTIFRYENGVCFAKGSGQYAGLELGHPEILTALTTIFRRSRKEMRLYDIITKNDLDIGYVILCSYCSQVRERVEGHFRKEGFSIRVGRPYDQP